MLQGRINLRFSVKDAVTGLLVSLALLVPFWYFMAHSGKGFAMLPAAAVLYQLVGISFPEEVYFRGFLQERLGNTRTSIVTVSVLFSLMHLPGVIFYGDMYSMLTFFPSLVMGFLYMKTSNVVPPTIFHAAANTVFLSFHAACH